MCIKLYGTVHKICSRSANLREREKAFVFKEEEDAEQALRLMQPIYQKMKDIQEQAKQKIDALRQDLLGKPEFDELAHA